MGKYITHEEPFAENVFTQLQMKDVYMVMVDKTEYPDYGIWLTDMLKSGIFTEV